MAKAADFSSPRYHSPSASDSSSDGAGGAVISPRPRRPGLPTQWAQVVRGDLAESIPYANQAPPLVTSDSPAAAEEADAPPCSSLPPADTASEVNNGNAGAKPKKPAWNKLSNGAVEVGPVMGAASWPALSESTRASPKSSAADSSQSKAVSDGSIIGSQGSSHLYQKQESSGANPNLIPNHTSSTPAPPARQKSMRRGTGNPAGSSATNSMTYSSPQQPLPLQYPYYQFPANGYGIMSLPDTSPRELQYRGNNWDSRPAGGFASQGVHAHRNYYRRGSFGPRSRGDAGYNTGTRRDQEHGAYGNAGDFNLQTPRAPPRGFVRPMSPNAALLLPPHAIRAFANPMAIPDFVYVPTLPVEPYRGVPIPPPAVVIPSPEPPLDELLRKQIEYYFSDFNLNTDSYLKSNMDEQGWVPITLIAGFNRVRNLTNNIPLIVDSLRTSNVLEVEDNKVRRRDEWMKWISVRLPSDSSSLSSGKSSGDNLAVSFQNMAVSGASSNQDDVPSKTDACSEAATGRCSSGTGQRSSLSNGEVH